MKILNNFPQEVQINASDFVGATSQGDGVHGLVPAPATQDREKYLKGDGSWAEVNTQDAFNYYYGLVTATITLTKDSQGNITQIVTVNDEATITTVFNKNSVGEITSIVATIVPTEGLINYVKTTSINNNTISITYTTEAKN